MSGLTPSSGSLPSISTLPPFVGFHSQFASFSAPVRPDAHPMAFGIPIQMNCACPTLPNPIRIAVQLPPADRVVPTIPGSFPGFPGIPVPNARILLAPVPELNVSPPQAVPGPKLTGRRFTQEDDARLTQIMMGINTETLRPNDWQQIQQDFGRPFTVEQIRRRWFTFLRPPLSRAEFTKDERKEALRLHLDTPTNWRQIAAKFGDGRSRSPEMMDNLLKTVTRKLTRFGLSLEHRAEVDLIPDAFFNRGFPSPRQRLELVQAFERAKRAFREGQVFPAQLRYWPYPMAQVPRTS
jgi:hypothetical protein